MRINRSVIITSTVLILVLIGAGFFAYYSISKRASESNPLGIIALQSKDARPYTDLDGNPVDLLEFKGKILFINSWATWTPFSRDELLSFRALKAEFNDRIQIIAMNRMEKPATARAFVDSLGIDNGITFLLDPDDHFYKSVGGFAMPETIVYDTEGNIVLHTRGPITLDEMREVMNTIDTTKND